MNPDDANKAIRERFRIKPRDTLPYTGWLRSTREDLYILMSELGFKKGAEVGVAKGLNARAMFRVMPGLHLILVDIWDAYSRLSQEKAQIRYESCVRRLRHYNVEYKIMPSSQAALEVPDASLDFVYIDGMHDFDFVMMDLILWAPKVKRGGIIAGHDYYEFYQSGIITAVRAYTYAHNIQDWYVTRAEKEASFFWVRN